MISKASILIFLFSYAFNSSACSIPPIESKELPVEAVYRSENAGIVNFYEFKLSNGKITFRGNVKRVFWGTREQLQSATFFWENGQKYVESDKIFSRTQPEFWTGEVSNLGYAPDCELLPKIKLGVDYIFLKSSPLSRYSLERHLTRDDPWYELVSKASWQMKKYGPIIKFESKRK